MAQGIRLTLGAEISDARHNHTCSSCKAKVLLGRVKDPIGTLKWRNFELPPIEKNGLRFYRRHFCPR